jgi:aminopeptidase N
MNLSNFKGLAAAIFALNCARSSQQANDSTLPPLPTDPHSYAQPEIAAVTHVSLDLTPDFETHRLSGTAKLALKRDSKGDTLTLDVRDLNIRRVTTTSGEALTFNVGAADKFLGSPLKIALKPGVDTIVIDYETSPNAAAVQWLSPEQTAGKRRPFLFTQGESILTRTWVPTQDSPGQRQTYDATIHTPAGMRAVMSAPTVASTETRDAQGRNVFRFRMEHPIPPYLIALAIGDIDFRPIGKNTGVYAEPSVVESAAREFAEVDQMIAAAEKLYGPYRWGRYDILVLPPSFPFGGMENPTLTFATPTILAGDRSLVSLVAHELAHSWSGNLVTNATWNDFWLNEGFTDYLEARIMEELRGKDYADMLRVLGRQDMNDAIKDAGGPTSPDTRLHLDLVGRDPDEGTTEIAYQKGAAFLQTVESVVGRQRLDAFLRDYFDHFAFQPMSSDRMLAYMKEKLLSDDEAKRINIQAWVYEPGVPTNIPAVTSKAFAAVDKDVESWKGGAQASTLQTSKWTTHEWVQFLRALPDTIPSMRLDDLDKTFHLSSSGNSEILFAWLMISIKNHYQPAMAALDRFLTSQGRRKFVRPLYTELMKSDWGKKLAVDIYRRARPTYHSVTSGSIDQIVKTQ